MTELFVLLAIFQFKHFICDYLLQTPYMLGKMQRTGWVIPLLAHAFVHAIFTFAITLLYSLPLAIILAVIDLVVHFSIDRIKASPDLGGRWKPDQPYFWWALGADQMAHHLTHYVFIYLIMTI